MGAVAGTRAALAAGTSIAGRYRVESLIGRGASSVVYRVTDARSGARIALKQLRVAGQRRAALLASQFEREYHTLCQLAHPRIIEVYDYGVDADDAFYTMELLDGQDLRERGKLPWPEACALLRDVASSLAILHSRRLLHRDLSARNVRCTSDGRAKLIDFGAMTPMGRVKNLVGTAPFVPPEALQLQALDARADLYALGALAYYVLSGRHAYAARSFDQLPDAWRSPPRDLPQLASGLPPRLVQLVTQLLHLDREGRPASAADVMERLCGIAGLAQERFEVTQAYLATPTLVGRDALVQEVRGELLGARLGQGACLLIAGEAGSGRSRVLDACVLEAKLLGALVLRAEAADAASGEYGVVRALCAQLREAAFDLAERSAQPRRELLAHVWGPPTNAASGRVSPPPARGHLLAALRDWLLSIARSRHLVIAVDDVEAIDEPSAALLAALAHETRQRSLSLLSTADAGAAATPALSVLRERARVLTLPPLAAPDCEALLRAVFGDVQHLSALAQRVHELSGGNPRWVMALCQHLVERGVARYEAGSWALPAALAPADLPASLSAALSARIDALPTDARALAEALALTDPSVLPLPSYPQLDEDGDHARTFGAISALLAAGVLVPAGDRYRFGQRELSALLVAGLPAERTRALHGRIARAVQGCDDPARLPHHLLLAGREREAIEQLLPLRADPAVGYSVLALELLDRAVGAAERLGLPMTVRVELLMWLIDNASMLGEYELFLQRALPLLEQFDRDSGLRDYRELGGALPEAERLPQALGRAQLRHDRTEEAQRGLPPGDAIPRLARLCAMFNTMTAVVQDLGLSERLPSLEPLRALSPALLIVHQLVDSTRDFQAGRYDSAGSKALEVLERVSQPDHGLGDASYHKAIRLGVLYTQAALAAGRGQPAVPAWIAELEHVPGHRVNAWRLRMAYELMQGNFEAARLCQRRAELLHLQDGGRLIFPGSTSRLELLAYSYAEDVLGVKRVMERIAGFAARYPGWQVTHDIACAMYRGLQGDLQGALAAIQPALAAAEPGRHLDWAFASTVRISFLNALGRHEEAADRALECLAICRRERLSPSHRSVMRVAAEALIGAGRLPEALAMAEDCVRETEAAGARGLLLRAVYETRARVAIAMGDEAAFQLFVGRYVEDSRRGHTPVFGSRFEQLLRDAAARGLSLPRALQGVHERPLDHAPVARSNAERELLSSVAPAERAVESLRLLLQATSATCGLLFGLRDGRLEPLAGVAPPTSTHGLRETLEHYFRSQLEVDAASTELDSSPAGRSELESWVDPAGRAFEPMLITGRRDGELFAIAVAALHHPGAERASPRRALLEAIGDALLEGADVDAVTCVA